MCRRVADINIMITLTSRLRYRRYYVVNDTVDVDDVFVTASLPQRWSKYKWTVVIIMSWAHTALDDMPYTAWQVNEPWPWIQIVAGYITVFVTGKVRLLDALVRRI